MTETILGTVHVSENRRSSASQQLWQLFKFKDIYFECVIPALEEADRLSDALSQNSIQQLAKILGVKQAAYIDSQFETGVGEEGTEDSEEGNVEENENDVYTDPVLDIIQADTTGVLINHPWVVSRLRRRFGKRWRRLAVSLTVPWASYLMQPLDVLPDNAIMVPDLAPGEYVCFRNPIRHALDIRVWVNLIDQVDEYNVRPILNKKGTMYVNTQTAATIGGDFDGDWLNILVSWRNQTPRPVKGDPEALPPGIVNWVDTINITKNVTYAGRPSC